MRISALLVTIFFTASVHASTPAQNEEISYLLAEISSSGCQFVRNGKVHTSEAAAAHLEMKYRNGRRFIDDAEQFIDRVATGSSWTGDPYLVACEGEAQIASAEWLNEALDTHRQNRHLRNPGGQNG